MEWRINVKVLDFNRCREYGEFGKFSKRHPCGDCETPNCPFERGFTPYEDNVVTLRITIDDDDNIISVELIPPEKRK